MQAKLGSGRDARFIRDWYALMSDYNHSEPGTPPNGWKCVGSGTYRTAYLHERSEVVYKVEMYYGRRWNQSNLDEFKAFRKVWLTRRIPEGVRLPECHLWDFGDGKEVTAMEYLPKLLRSEQWARDLSDKKSRLLDLIPECWDLHDRNIAIDDRRNLVPIDLGGIS